ncbi:uncharacterized protein BKA78DRAFT_26541 [Phyllosticta capitalensis]|uniref:uncharacterized protein n=1 Tax=Phyllosticta capitalensis TaxID=121624 RepID=UPI00312EDAE0
MQISDLPRPALSRLVLARRVQPMMPSCSAKKNALQSLSNLFHLHNLIASVDAIEPSPADACAAPDPIPGHADRVATAWSGPRWPSSEGARYMACALRGGAQVLGSKPSSPLACSLTQFLLVSLKTLNHQPRRDCLHLLRVLTTPIISQTLEPPSAWQRWAADWTLEMRGSCLLSLFHCASSLPTSPSSQGKGTATWRRAA